MTQEPRDISIEDRNLCERAKAKAAEEIHYVVGKISLVYCAIQSATYEKWIDEKYGGNWIDRMRKCLRSYLYSKEKLEDIIKREFQE